jgi:hypothetical protein
MKVILFLAAVYSLIINQCHEKDKTASNKKPLPVQYTQSVIRDTMQQTSTHIQFAAGLDNSRSGALPMAQFAISKNVAKY